MDPAGMCIVKVTSSAVMVPENVPRIMFGIPEKLMLPVTSEPLCVSCHVIVPAAAWPIIPPPPTVAVLESDAVPVQVPSTDVTDPGIVGEPPPQAVAAAMTPNSAARMNPLVMIHSLLRIDLFLATRVSPRPAAAFVEAIDHLPWMRADWQREPAIHEAPVLARGQI
jgi:hypothetical protein